MPSWPEHSDEVMIERAGARDVPRIVELMRQLAEIEGRREGFAATSERVREALFAARPGLECWVARIDGQVGAIALCAFSWSGGAGRATTRLVNMIVDAPHRNQGIGRRLFTAVAVSCVDHGRDLDLMVREENEAAQHFYARLGGIPRHGWQPWRFSDDALARLAATAR